MSDGHVALELARQRVNESCRWDAETKTVAFSPDWREVSDEYIRLLLLYGDPTKKAPSGEGASPKASSKGEDDERVV